MKLNIIYQDNNFLIVDKPAGLTVFSEKNNEEETVINALREKYSYLNKLGEALRYGLVHRLDKETSGILIVAKNEKYFRFFQKQFQERLVKKKYLALISGNLKKRKGTIETFIGRDFKNRKKQKSFSLAEPKKKGQRKAISSYQVLKKFKNYDLVEVEIKTGRKHQIRCHFSYLGHPIVGDKIYSFKNQKIPNGLHRQFLHAGYLKIKLPNGEIKEFISPLPNDLEKTLKNLNKA